MKIVDEADGVIRVLLVGFGLSGKLFHGPLIRATVGMEITGIVTSSKILQADAKEIFPNAQLFSTLDKALMSPNQFDLIVIASATPMHFRQCLASLSYGAHVVVEKPISGNEKEALEIQLHAMRSNLNVYVFQNRRWDSDFLTLQYLSQVSSVGSIKRFESRMESSNPVIPETWRNSANPADLGGVLLDLGVHLVDQAIEFMGPVYSISAELESKRKNDIAEDQFTMRLRHSNFTTSLLIGSKAQKSICSRFTAEGENGVIRINSYDSQESELRKGVIPNSSEWGREPPSSFAEIEVTFPKHQIGVKRFPLLRGRWHHFYTEVFNSITTGSASPVPIFDAINNMKVLDAARQSHIDKTEIVLDVPATHATKRQLKAGNNRVLGGRTE